MLNSKINIGSNVNSQPMNNLRIRKNNTLRKPTPYNALPREERSIIPYTKRKFKNPNNSLFNSSMEDPPLGNETMKNYNGKTRYKIHVYNELNLPPNELSKLITNQRNATIEKKRLKKIEETGINEDAIKAKEDAIQAEEFQKWYQAKLNSHTQAKINSNKLPNNNCKPNTKKSYCAMMGGSTRRRKRR
jgi:hypothetical protein